MENKKRILIFSTAYLPLIGGAEVAVSNITDKISDFEFDLITAKIQPGLSDFEKKGNINVYRVGFGNDFDKILLPVCGLMKGLWLNRKNKYCLVWSIMASYGGFAGLFYKIFKPKTKFLLTLQEGDDLSYIEKRVGIFYPLFRQIFKRADHIQAISNFLAQWAKDMGAKCPIEVVPNGVNLEWFTQMDYDDLFRLRKSQMFGGHLILTTSRLVEKNGIEYLIRAMSNIDGRLNILGDGKLSEQLKRLAKELKIENKVHFGGFINQEKILDSLIDASVFCRPSLSEGLGNSFLEAMAVKIPVIATPVGGIPDFLTDGETGWFCKVKDPQSIAEKINYVLDEKNQPEVKRVVENAYKLVSEKYTWGNVARRMNTIFVQLIN